MAFLAAPGETNAVTADLSSGGTVSVQDTGATLKATGTCTAIDAHRATCPLRVSTTSPESLPAVLHFGLGDGNDTLRLIAPDLGEGIAFFANGQAGDDVLDASRAVTPPRFLNGDATREGLIFLGGPGNDHLIGGASGQDASELDGEDGADTLDGGAAGTTSSRWPGQRRPPVATTGRTSCSAGRLGPAPGWPRA